MILSHFCALGSGLIGNILNNFKSDNFIINIARFCFGVNMFTTLPLENFVCREVRKRVHSMATTAYDNHSL